MHSANKKLLRDISLIKQVIKKKYNALRNNDFEAQRQLAIRYKPILEPLKALTRDDKMTVKVETIDEPKEEPTINEMEEYQFENEELEDDISEEPSPEEEESLPSEEPIPSEEPFSSEQQPTRSLNENLPPNIDDMLLNYLNFILYDGKAEADFTYGIYYDEGWKMGRYPIQFINNDIIIQNRRYKGTPGLFELIFKKHPKNVFTQNDLDAYKAMLHQTRAHEGKDGKVISNKGYKYTNIISNMFPPKKRLIQDVVLTPLKTRAKRALSRENLFNSEKRKKLGKGIMLPVTSNEVDYRYWDDPNELCDRLRLLIASRKSGNTGNDVEIISILEELKEANIIKDFDSLLW